MSNSGYQLTNRGQTICHDEPLLHLFEFSNILDDVDGTGHGTVFAEYRRSGFLDPRSGAGIENLYHCGLPGAKSLKYRAVVGRTGRAMRDLVTGLPQEL